MARMNYVNVDSLSCYLAGSGRSVGNGSNFGVDLYGVGLNHKVSKVKGFGKGFVPHHQYRNDVLHATN